MLAEQEHDDRAADLLDEALSLLRKGQPADEAALQARYPDLAGDVPSFLKTLRALDAAAANWKSGKTLDEGDAPTGPHLATPEGPPILPETLGRYRIVRYLGGGGMGDVYLALDPQLHRQVAVKTLRVNPSRRDPTSARQRFLREARAAARVRHPHICPIYDVGEQDGVPYAVMAYIEGTNLAEWLKHERPDASKAVELVRKVAHGLEAIHAQGIVHRDLKPANILLDAHGEPLVTDFGLARPENDEAALTQEGDVLGTWGYMAPEQAAGNTAKIGPWSDVYSLGVVLYRMLTGVVPTPHDAPLSNLPPTLDPGLRKTLGKALARQPEDRFRHAGDFAAALEAWPPTRTGGSSAPRRRRVLFAGIAAALILGVILVPLILMLTRNDDGQPKREAAKGNGALKEDKSGKGGAFALTDKKSANEDQKKAVVSPSPDDKEPLVVALVSKLGIPTRLPVTRCTILDPDTRDKNGNVVSSLRNELGPLFGDQPPSVCLEQAKGLFVLIPLTQVKSIESQDKQHVLTLTDGSKQQGTVLTSVHGKDDKKYDLVNAKSAEVRARTPVQPVAEKEVAALVSVSGPGGREFRFSTYDFPSPPHGPIRMTVNGDQVEGAVADFKKISVARTGDGWGIAVTPPAGPEITGKLEIRFGRWWLRGQLTNGWWVILSSIHGSAGFTLEKAPGAKQQQ